MRKVIGIGETILDIIFKNNRPTSGTPGGSVFNGMISLGRLGQDVCFVSDVGRDRVGRLICDFMQENGVSDRYVNRHPSARTAVSLAFLDDNNDADYTFFKDYSYEGLQGEFPPIAPDDIVVFGSYYALNPLLRPRMKVFLEQARRAGALIYYDINFRKSHTYEAATLTPVLVENFDYADILRGSVDDFMALYAMSDPGAIYRDKIGAHTRCFVYTAGAKQVRLQTPCLDCTYTVKPITPLSTVGAGDSFNAGIVFGLLKNDIRRAQLPTLGKEGWDSIIGYAMRFSAEVCQSYDNYISRDTARALTQEE